MLVRTHREMIVTSSMEVNQYGYSLLFGVVSCLFPITLCAHVCDNVSRPMVPICLVTIVMYVVLL